MSTSRASGKNGVRLGGASPPSSVDGPLFKRALLGSLNWLAANQEEVNRLNVFPVPDGDTGTNMLLTLQSAVEDIKDSNALEVSRIARLASHGSLMGARGNSGVILSQIFRGFARAVEGKATLQPKELAAAFEEAANAAYRAVNRPTEGTILTVAREAGRTATAAASDPDASAISVIAAAAAGARAAVLKTPSQLQILRDAGVVDAGGYGKLLKLNVGDMSSQHRRILEGEAPAAAKPPRANGVGMVAVVAGKGLVEIFKALGVDAIVEGGQTMNPSTQDLLTAVDTVPYDHVVLLPNNGNVILAAKEIAGLTKKKVHLIETHNVPQGVAAVVAFSPERNVDQNIAAMRAEAERVQTIEVTHAVRDTRSNGLRVKKGDVIGLVNDRLEFTGSDYSEVVQRALGRLGPDDYELVTVYRGEDASDEELEKLESSIRSSYPALEVEVQQGGQLHYPFILSVE